MPRKPEPKHNKLCQRCEKSCKQPSHVVVISCPDFKAAPVQLTIDLKFPPGRPKKLKN